LALCSDLLIFCLFGGGGQYRMIVLVYHVNTQYRFELPAWYRPPLLNTSNGEYFAGGAFILVQCLVCLWVLQGIHNQANYIHDTFIDYS